MGLFDTHAHYDDEKFDGQRDEILKGLRHESGVNPLGVSLVVNIGCNYPSSQESLKLSYEYPFVYATVGVHPQFADDYDEALEGEIKELLSDPRAVAVGEIGLDYHYEDGASRETQLYAFRRQMQLACDAGKRVVVHDREAHGDCMEVVREFRGKTTGVFHSFSGSYEMAKELVSLGWYVSFSGTVTFKNAHNVQRSVLAVPDDRLLIETDSPYLAPVPYRGQMNNSALMYETAKKIAEIRETSVEHIAPLTLDNGKRFYNIDG